MKRTCLNSFFKVTMPVLAVVKLPEPKQQPAPYTGPSSKEINALRRKHMNPMHKHYYKEPIMLATGKNQYVWDGEGKRYLDFYSGVSSLSVGHSNDECVAAVVEQMNRIQHVTPLYDEPATYQFMDRLSKHLPKGKDWVFHFTNSGSEANDFAMYLARYYTGRGLFAGVQNCYHGLTDSSRCMVSAPGWRGRVPPAVPTVKGLAPTSYRGIFGDDVEKYVETLENSIDIEGGAIAAFIAERIQGIGGLYPLLDGYLPRVYDAVRKRGGLVISDEVQCGFGRLGKTFWGFELDGVVPDIITCAKSMSNGLPLGLVITTREIASSLDHSFFNTFGGNPISCAHANAALKVIEEQNYMAHNTKMGDHMIAELNKLKEKYDVLADVRGMGIMVGAEFVTDRQKKTPLPADKFTLIHEDLREAGILVGKGGKGNIMRIQGPYCITEEDIDYFIYSLDKSLKKNF